jgi:uncharacterized membrane protein SirB2
MLAVVYNYFAKHYSPRVEINIGIWDILLILGVSLQTTIIAFVRHPRAKAFVYSFPLPFTLANLALGEPVNTAHVLGLANLLLYINMVRWLHRNARIHIVPSVAGAALLYCGVAVALNPVIPSTPNAFWTSFVIVMTGAVVLIAVLRYRDEPESRSELPYFLKFMVVAAVISVLVVLKDLLGGFMSLFPMVGVIAAYETRNSMWTMTRQAPLVVVSIGCMVAAMWIVQQQFGWEMVPSLGIGICLWASVLVPVTLVRWRRENYLQGNVDRAAQ